MAFTAFKIILSAVIISFVSWLSAKKPVFAGFLTALPLTTLLALAFTHSQWQDPEVSVKFAQSIFYAVPITLVFFIPFLLANKFQLSFWVCYIIGLFLLFIGYLIHSYIMKFF